MIDLLVLEDATIAGLWANPNFAREFPAIAAMRPEEPAPGPGCSACAQNAYRNRLITANRQVRTALSQISPAQWKTLLSILDARRVQMTYVSPAGERIRRIYSG